MDWTRPEGRNGKSALTRVIGAMLLQKPKRTLEARRKEILPLVNMGTDKDAVIPEFKVNGIEEYKAMAILAGENCENHRFKTALAQIDALLKAIKEGTI